jgi:hypothetical protein
MPYQSEDLIFLLESACHFNEQWDLSVYEVKARNEGTFFRLEAPCSIYLQLVDQLYWYKHIHWGDTKDIKFC